VETKTLKFLSQIIDLVLLLVGVIVAILGFENVMSSLNTNATEFGISQALGRFAEMSIGFVCMLLGIGLIILGK
jgi:uncharacterized membrane protein